MELETRKEGPGEYTLRYALQCDAHGRIKDLVDEDCTTSSFVFFTETKVLLGVLELPDEDDEVMQEYPTLNIVDFSIGVDTQRRLWELDPQTRHCFLFPELRAGTIPVRIDVRSDPSPGWKPSEDLQAPFHVSSERLFVISLSVVESLRLSTIAFLTLQSVVLDIIDSCGAENSLGRKIPWEQWGPEGTRMTEVSFSAVWACYTYGTKCVLPFQRRDSNGQIHFRIVDFDRTSLKKRDEGQLFRGKNTLSTEIWFKDKDLSTSLPFRMISKEFKGSFRPSCSPMIAEDSLIVVDVCVPAVSKCWVLAH